MTDGKRTFPRDANIASSYNVDSANMEEFKTTIIRRSGHVVNELGACLLNQVVEKLNANTAESKLLLFSIPSASVVPNLKPCGHRCRTWVCRAYLMIIVGMRNT